MINKRYLLVFIFAFLSQQSFADAEKFYLGGGVYFPFNGSIQFKGDKKSDSSISFSHIDDDSILVPDRMYKFDRFTDIILGHSGRFRNIHYRIEGEIACIRSEKVDYDYVYANKLTLSNLFEPQTFNTSHHDFYIHRYLYMLNFYYDWKSDSRAFYPYVGIGTGMAISNQSDLVDQKMSFQLKAGLNLRVFRNTEFVLGYRYFCFFDNVKGSLDSHEHTRFMKYEFLPIHGLEFGIRLYFDFNKEQKSKFRSLESYENYESRI